MARGGETKKKNANHHGARPHLFPKPTQTPRELFKILLLAPLVIPRCAAAIAACIVLAAISAVAAAGWPLDEPLPRHRRALAVAGSKLAGVVLWCLGFSIKLEGRQNIAAGRRERAVAVFNHVAWADAPLIMYLLAASGVSRAENAAIPVIGTCIKAFQNIYVARDAKGGSKSRGVAAAIAGRVADPRWPMVVVAPEGTCGDGRCVLRFRSGAFVPGAPVLPVVLKYESQHYNPAWTIVHEGAHFLRCMCQFRKRVHVTVLPPYHPSAAERADPALYAANVRRLFADTLGVPVVDQGYEEFAALLRAGVRVGADGASIVAPPGVVDGDGFADLRAAAARGRRGKSE